MDCGCRDRLMRLLDGMGFTLEGERGLVTYRSARGSVQFDVDGGKHHFRLAVMAIIARLCLGRPLPVSE